MQRGKNTRLIRLMPDSAILPVHGPEPAIARNTRAPPLQHKVVWAVYDVVRRRRITYHDTYYLILNKGAHEL